MPDSSPYTLQEVQRDAEFVLLRGYRTGLAEAGRPSVLVRTPVADPPTTESLRKLHEEYDLRAELASDYVVRPLSLLEIQHQPMLILEDPGGTPLDLLLNVTTGIEGFLSLAVSITAAIGHLHSRGLVHKDIKPANILVSAARDRAWLMGLGSASRLPRGRQPAQSPDPGAGTLAYMAPEQTGRMNRSIDFRSDLYSLGVTLYELLTGSLPFAASDPMEWVHSHIARKPVAPEDRSGRIPTQISRIVMRLLAKTAEERYQTAVGVERDLRRCLADWHRQGWIDAFALAEHDAPDRLSMPEKLYGRAREVESLLECFDRVLAGGAPELVLVRGGSGIGKSSLVGELQRALAPGRGLFATGKFDRFRDIPYATLGQAFQGLVRFLLSRSEAELQSWRATLHEALGPNGQLMVNLVPDLQLIIGVPVPVPELPPQDAQRRFQRVFRRFIGVFARAEQPLVLFLDDLQWLDAATLDLVEDLLTQADVRHLLLVGAYRDTEVEHSLRRTLEAIRNAGAPVRELELEPLTLADLTHWVADCLHKEPDQAVALAELIHQKTAGNPLFAVQLLAALVEERLLTFDYDAGGWCWDLGIIRAKGYTDNVLALMVGKLNRLPRETQDALQLLACMGNSAELGMLQLVARQSAGALQGELEEALRAGLILREEQTYKFFHDRVQEAAYSSIPADVRAEMHLHIGRLLAAHIPAQEREARIFEIVNQLNRGSQLIGAEEHTQCAELNLLAGSQARRSTAYASALVYLRAARALLTEEAWDGQYSLIFSIEFELAECEVLTADMVAAERRLAMLAVRARRTHDVARVTRLRTTLYTTLDRSDRGIEVCLEFLRNLGTDWSLHPTPDEVAREYGRIWEQLGDRSIEELLDLPLMTDPDVLDVFDVLSDMVTPAHYCDVNLPALILCRMVNLSLEYGNSDGSCIAYLGIATIAGPRFGDGDEVGFRFGQIGHDLVEKRGLKRFRARFYALFGNLIMPWTRPLREGRELIRRGLQAANEMGDLTYAAYSFNYLVAHLLTSGEPLVEAQLEAEKCLSFQQKTRFGLTTDVATIHLALIRTLRGSTAKFGALDAPDRDEIALERHLSGNPGLAFGACWYWIRKLQARYLAGDSAAAVDAASKARQLLWTSPLHPETSEWCFYGALAHAAAWDGATADEKEPHAEALIAHGTQLESWAARCPENFQGRAALVAAEAARIEGRELDAQRLYEEAIRTARAAGFIHIEALSYELAARFYAVRGFEEFSRVYLQRARAGYLGWGAIGKVRQLEGLHPNHDERRPAPAPAEPVGAPVVQLDLATVMKVSQAVSSDMDLAKLIDTLMRTAIEYAGAERGLLILQRGVEQRIVAEVTITEATVSVQMRDDEVSPVELPESVLHSVGRTQELAIVDDASAHSCFASDPYVVRRRPRSILCLPLSNRGKLIGVLYLENNLAARVFAPTRVQVLKLLASQAAISLENTRLYHDLAEREARIRRLVEANVVGIEIWDFDGRIIEANEAFLDMLGYDQEDLVSGRLRWTELSPAHWHGRDRDPIVEQMRHVGIVPPFEWEFIHKDGSRVPVLIGAARFTDSNQGVAFVVDLSERKRVEQALRQSQAYLAEAQRLARMGSWAYDHVGGKITYWSDETFRLFGLDPRRGHVPQLEEIAQLIHPEGREEVLTELAQVFRDKAEYLQNYRIVMADGTVRHLHSIGHPVLDERGELVEYVGTVMDVTERRAAEQRLLAQHRVSLILAEAPTLEDATPKILQAVGECMGWHLGALWRTDREARVLRCTDLWRAPWVEATQYEAATRTSTFRSGHGLPGRVWASRAPACIPDVAHDPEGERPEIAAREGLHAAFAFPILVGNEVLGVMGFVSRSVWRSEQDLLVMMATLGSQIGQFAERKRAESALQLAQSELAHVTRVMTMGELTASIAHEVNQPLGAIVTSAASCTRWLAAEPPNIDKAMRALDRIVNDGKRASQVIGRIRALMKRQTPRKGWLDVNETLHEVIALAQYALRRNNIVLETRLARSLPLVQGDRVQLQQVLLNLIVNAIEAMSEVEGRRRELTLVSTTDGPDAVAVEVRDSGTGLDPQFATHLFEPFYTTKAEGIGIGLSISRSIVEAHGGSLSATANEPHGAVFRFSLPVREAVS